MIYFHIKEIQFTILYIICLLVLVVMEIKKKQMTLLTILHDNLYVVIYCYANNDNNAIKLRFRCVIGTYNGESYVLLIFSTCVY